MIWFGGKSSGSVVLFGERLFLVADRPYIGAILLPVTVDDDG